MSALPLDLAEIWRAVRARARSPHMRAMLDTVDELRSMCRLSVIGVRPCEVRGELCVVWAVPEQVARRRERSS